MKLKGEENFKDIHYDVLETFYKREEFKKLINETNEYCLSIDEIKNYKLHNLGEKYTIAEIEKALEDIIDAGYLIKKDDRTYCAIGRAFKTALEETF